MELHERLQGNGDGHAISTTRLNVPFSDVKNRIHSSLIEQLGRRLFNSELEPRALRTLVIGEVQQRLQQETGISVEDRERLVGEITDDILGHGPLERLLADDSITEIMVNGPDDVWVERSGRLHRTPVRFSDESQLRRVISKIVAEVGRRIDESSPMVDARLADGSRVNATLPPLSLSGPLLTIRKFGRDRMDMDTLVRVGSLSRDSAEFLTSAVQARLNILIAGGTGSGKTTLLNAMSGAIPETERIITIEDAAELQLRQRHVLRLESRPPNIEGEGAVAIRDLVRNSLRMRPDRIVVGEVRGAEALDMLQAMNTGHDGSLSTVHANSPRDALARVETMVLMAGYDLPLRAVRQQVCAAVDLIVQVERLHDGTRRIVAITEIQGMESEIVTLQDLYLFRVDAVASTTSRSVVGSLNPTGLRPTFIEKFERRGIALPAGLVQAQPSLRRDGGR